MAAVINLDGVASVRVEYETKAEFAMNVLYYKLISVTLPGGGGTLFPGEQAWRVLPKLAEEVYSKLTTSWTNIASEDVTAIGATAQSVWPTPKSRQYSFTPPVPNEGLVEGDSLPLQDCITYVKKGALGLRSHMGRVFVPGIPESSANGGKLLTGVLGFWDINASFYAQLVTYEQDDLEFTWEPGLFKLLPDGTHTWVKILDVDVSDDVIKTQRRRRPGKGM